MQFRASHRYAHISARKARPAANLIRGLEINTALQLLEGSLSRGAALFTKVLRSAVANASQNEAVDVNNLIVSDARVDEGPLVHGRARFRPGAMGRAMPIRRRTAHIKVTVSEREEV
ncbi:MAG: 50S ribosomal protein L22 [Planctomycetota bacterium]